jgi:diguanylate cyclase (GGDEF)-like protein
MKHRKRRVLPGLVILLVGLIAHCIGGAIQSIVVPLSLIGAGAWLALSIRIFKPLPSFSPGISASGHTLPQVISQEVSEEVAQVNVSALGAQYRKDQWNAVEKTVDGLLDIYIQVLRNRLDGHTIAVLFPTNDGGYRIRRFFSKSEHVNNEAVIYPGVGVIGSFLKDGLKQLNLHEIVTDSMTLYYYKKDAGIRSLMASPIVAEGIERGVIIVDSTETKHFSDEDHGYLSSVAQLVGSTVYYAYTSTEHRLEHKRIASMSSIEKDFFQNLTIDAILDRMVEIIPFAISCDRLTISLRGPEKNLAVIRRAWAAGDEAEAKAETGGFKDKCFSLDDKTLISLVYARNMSLYRDFVEDHYETRYYEGESRPEDLASFLAFPIGVDMCKGAFFLESSRKKAFSDSNRDLLARLATSAGLAIEKLQIIEQANALATHDGLTGLINHRQFQAMLKDEITRAIRYDDPLSLVIGDIDFFKKVNDTYGHQFGDVVLREISAKLKEKTRDGVDFVARYGGEEFALVLVKTDGSTAVDTVERIRQHIEQYLFKGPHGEDIRITMSFGIAVYKEHAKQIDTLIQKADKALYRAKETGRNKVELF